MQTFTVHRKAELLRLDADATGHDHLFIKDGFSWIAFLIPLPWLLWNRLWLVSILYLGVIVSISLLGYMFSFPEELVMVLSLLANLMTGLEANDLRRTSLLKRGYHEVADVVADDKEHACYRYFATRHAIQSQAG